MPDDGYFWVLFVGADEGLSSDGNAVEVRVILDEDDLVPKGAANSSSEYHCWSRGVRQNLRSRNSGTDESGVDVGNGFSGICKLLLVIGA